MLRRASAAQSDQELLAACLKGDQLAWDALVTRYAALLYSIPLKYGLGEADAADVFQSVCLTLVEKLGSVREPDRLAAWMVTTASRECLAVIRKRKLELSRLSADAEPSPTSELADPGRLPEEELLALERQHVVRTAVSQLPDACRRLVEQLFSDSSEKPSYQQLAGGLGIPINSLGPTRSRCLARLKQLLTHAGYFAR